MVVLTMGTYSQERSSNLTLFPSEMLEDNCHSIRDLPTEKLLNKKRARYSLFIIIISALHLFDASDPAREPAR